MIVEEQDVLVSSSNQMQNVKDLRVLHVECDCLECKQEDDLLEEPASVLAVTRSGKRYQKDKEVKDSVFKARSKIPLFGQSKGKSEWAV